MSDTIRLSGRLELRPDEDGDMVLFRDGRSTHFMPQESTQEALIEACNPPRYDLPPGVIHGSDGKFYAPGDVVRTLDDQQFTAHYPNGTRPVPRNIYGKDFLWYEVRPTAANPLPVLPVLPDTCWQIPDGRILWFYAEEGEYLDGCEVWNRDEWRRPDDMMRPGMWFEVRFPAKPATETIDTRLAKGRKLPNGAEITEAGDHRDRGPWFTAYNEFRTYAPTITVLVEGDAS